MRLIETTNTLQISVLLVEKVVEFKRSMRLRVVQVNGERKRAFGVVGLEKRLAVRVETCEVSLMGLGFIIYGLLVYTDKGWLLLLYICDDELKDVAWHRTQLTVRLRLE